MRCRWCSNPEGFLSKDSYPEYKSDDFLKEAKSCEMMFFSSGGVTFTGGEATLNHEELIKTLKLLKENNIHTALETNGTSPYLMEIIKYVDYLIMDFKHFDDDILYEYTHIKGDVIKENFKKITDAKIPCHIRIPLINEFNASYPKEFALYFSKFDTENVKFEFLAYHEYGKQKWEEEYKIKDGFITKEILQTFKDEFKKQGLICIET